MITILMTMADGGYLKTVTYFDENGKMKQADFSKLKIESENICFEELAKHIEASEFDLKIGKKEM